MSTFLSVLLIGVVGLIALLALVVGWRRLIRGSSRVDAKFELRAIDALTKPPDEVGMFHSRYVCANCGAQHDGFPPDVDRNNKPLCPNCRTLP